MNVCGVLVQLAPAKALQALALIAAMPGVEIHGGQESGRLVVTVDDVDGPPAADTLTALHRVDGVIAAALVYHAYEESEAEPALVQAGS